MKNYGKSVSEQIKQQSHLYVVEEASGLYSVRKNRSGEANSLMSAGEVIYQFNTDKHTSIEKISGEVLVNFEPNVSLPRVKTFNKSELGL